MAKSIILCCCLHPFYDTRILHKIANSLSLSGYSVTIVAPSSRNYTHIIEPCGVVAIEYKEKKSRLRRIYNMFTLLKVLFKQKSDMLVGCEVESWLSCIVFKVIKLNKVKLVFDVHEYYSSYYSEKVRFQCLRPIIQCLIQQIFRTIGFNTNLVVFAKLGAGLDFKNSKIEKVVVFNYIDKRTIKLWSDLSNGQFEKKKWFAVHIGPMADNRGWRQLCEALTLTRQDFRILLIGSENEKNILSYAKILGVEHLIDTLPKIPYSEIASYLNNSKVGLMLYQPNILNHVWAFPLKLYDYMAVGLPVIAPDFSVEIIPVIKKFGNGILVESNDPKSISNAFHRLNSSYSEYQIKAQKAKKCIPTLYCWEKEFEKLQNAFETLFNRNQ